MFKYATNPLQVELFRRKLELTCDSESSSVNLKDALSDPMHRGATWVNFGYMIFHELTGINMILQYSNSIFSQMHSDGSSITASQGTFLIEISHLLATSCS